MVPDRPPAIDLAALSADITASLEDLLIRRAQASSQAVKAFREAVDTAWRSLEQVEASGGEEASRVVDQLTCTVAGHLRAVADTVDADAEVRIQAAVAETKRQRHEIATLSSSLEEVRADLQVVQRECDTRRRDGSVAAAEAERLREEAAVAADRLREVQVEADRLRFELETERRQASSMVLEVGQSRLAAQQATRARAETVAELQKESRDRQAFENQLLETKALLEATRKEATAIRQKLRGAIAEALRLVAAADTLDVPQEERAAVASPPGPLAASPPASTPPLELIAAKPIVVSEPAPPRPAVEAPARIQPVQAVQAEEPRPEAANDGAGSSRFFRRRLASMVRG